MKGRQIPGVDVDALTRDLQAAGADVGQRA